MSDKEKIIELFFRNVKGKSPDTRAFDQNHDGKGGHWLEQMMGISANASNSPDLYGFEMKNDTTSKTTFGDWSADYYIFKDPTYSITRDGFLHIFGKPNLDKGGRHSWSGEPAPKIKKYNGFGQILSVDSANNIEAKYSYGRDGRQNKNKIVPQQLQIDDLIIAKWNAQSLKRKLENKFNKKGWFKCLKDQRGIYDSIVFGLPISYQNWIELVKSGDVFFDSGMYEGNIRPYSQWRADNSFWEKLIVSRH